MVPMISFVLLYLLSISAAAPLDARRAPLRRSPNPKARAVSPNSYIVSLKPDTVDPTNRGGWLNRILTAANVTMCAEQNSTLRLGWNENVMNAIAGTFSDEVLDVIRSQEEVEYVEPGKREPASIRSPADKPGEYIDYLMSIYETVQHDDAPWGISRLSTGRISLAGNDPLALQYPYFSDSSAGSGTDIYILDTGIRTSHSEFEGRATFLQTFGRGVPGQDVNGRESPQCLSLFSGS